MTAKIAFIIIILRIFALVVIPRLIVARLALAATRFTLITAGFVPLLIGSAALLTLPAIIAALIIVTALIASLRFLTAIVASGFALRVTLLIPASII